MLLTLDNRPGPCEIFDANGVAVERCVEADLETGRVKCYKPHSATVFETVVPAPLQVVRRHPVEDATIAAQPSIGSGDFSKCLPGWIETFCNKVQEKKGYVLSHEAVCALTHTLLAAKMRCERLVRERDDARNIRFLLAELKHLLVSKSQNNEGDFAS